MEKTNRTVENEFHAVGFMRKVRFDLSEKYLQNKQQYIKDLKKAIEDFKRRQQKALSQQVNWPSAKR